MENEKTCKGLFDQATIGTMYFTRNYHLAIFHRFVERSSFDGSWLYAELYIEGYGMVWRRVEDNGIISPGEYNSLDIVEFCPDEYSHDFLYRQACESMSERLRNDDEFRSIYVKGYRQGYLSMMKASTDEIEVYSDTEVTDVFSGMAFNTRYFTKDGSMVILIGTLFETDGKQYAVCIAEGSNTEFELYCMDGKPKNADADDMAIIARLKRQTEANAPKNESNGNIFDNAKFGDVFETRDGHLASFYSRFTKDDGTEYVVLYVEVIGKHVFEVELNGRLCREYNYATDIVRKVTQA